MTFPRSSLCAQAIVFKQCSKSVKYPRLEGPLEVSCPSPCSERVQLAPAAQGLALEAGFEYLQGSGGYPKQCEPGYLEL